MKHLLFILLCFSVIGASSQSIPKVPQKQLDLDGLPSTNIDFGSQAGGKYFGAPPGGGIPLFRYLQSSDLPSVPISKLLKDSPSTYISPNALGSGTTSEINFLRGDGQWAEPWNIGNHDFLIEGNRSIDLADNRIFQIGDIANRAGVTLSYQSNTVRIGSQNKNLYMGPAIFQMVSDYNIDIDAPVVRLTDPAYQGGIAAGKVFSTDNSGTLTLVTPSTNSANVTSITMNNTSYSLTGSDDVVIGTVTGGTAQMVLPDPASTATGRIYRIVFINDNVNDCVVKYNGIQILAGSDAWISVEYINSGTDWVKLYQQTP